jgi:hypothetical protein
MENIETMIYAENGFPIEDRLGKVKETLEPIFEAQKEKYLQEYLDLLDRGVKKATMKTISPFTIRGEVYKACSQFKTIDNSIANNATAEQITQTFADFLELVSWLNEYGIFIPTKQIFSAFSSAVSKKSAEKRLSFHLPSRCQMFLTEKHIFIFSLDNMLTK